MATQNIILFIVSLSALLTLALGGSELGFSLSQALQNVKGVLDAAKDTVYDLCEYVSAYLQEVLG